MKSLFDQSQSKEIINRINKLTKDSKAEWGKMNVSQMFAHAEMPLRQALGEAEIKRSLIGKLLGGYAKKKIFADEPFKKNLPTTKEFVMNDEKDFESEKIRLINAIDRFTKAGPEGLSKNSHPFFGDLKPTEWDMLMYKHLDHHLRQFGV